MREKNFIFRGQAPDEEVKAWSRKHWIFIMPDLVSFFVFILIVGLAIVLLKQIQLPQFADPIFKLLIACAITGTWYAIHRFFSHLLNFFASVIIITNQRILDIKKTVFLNDNKESIDLSKIQDVEFRQEGLIKNLLKIGEVYIKQGNGEVKILSHIPNPDFHFRLLNKLKLDLTERKQQIVKPADEIEETRPNEEEKLSGSPGFESINTGFKTIN